VTRLGRSTLVLNSKAPEQMTAECWRWRQFTNVVSLQLSWNGATKWLCCCTGRWKSVDTW